MTIIKFCFTISIFISLNVSAQDVGKVFTVGAMNDMGKNNFATQVWLDTIPQKTHLYGMGPYDRMKGEIMIFDGKPFYASAFEEGKAVVSQSWDIRSPFFVYANVTDWESFDFKGDIKSLDDIQNQVASIAKSNGYDILVPFPFKITGAFGNITMHIVTPRSPDIIGYKPDVKQQLFTFNDISGSMLGFYSQKHQGVFTSSNSFLHVHFLSDDLTFMGHLDKINTQTQNLKLHLPRKNNHIKTGMRVNDTDFSKGRLGLNHELNLEDFEKFHGHLCDGLVVGFLGIKEGLKVLYPDGVIDRTNTRIVSKSSPCLTDVAVYATGGRYQFNSFYVDNSIEDAFYVLQRIDNGKAVKVQLKKGIKPLEIDELGNKAIKGELPACDLDELKKMEDDFSSKLLATEPKDNFTVTEVKNFKWKPILKNDFIKTDILNKNKAECN